MNICESCGIKHDGSYGSGRFCSKECARGFSHKNFKLSENAKEKISASLKKRWKNKNFEHVNWSLAVGNGTKGKFKDPENILEISSRTTSKIFLRLIKNEKFGCSRCGWNEGTGDLHHINGKKIENPDHHSNLTYLCPNCHRLVHQHTIEKSSLISLEKQIGDIWKKYYYG